MRRLLLPFTIGAAVTILDQWTKWTIGRHFQLGETQVLIGGILNLTHVRNPGVAFGMLAGFGWRWPVPFSVGLMVLAFVLLLWIYREARHLLLGRVALGLILGGALGNLIDRLRLGAVVDFIDVGVAGYWWPTFNVADSAITAGTGLLFLALWRARSR